MSRIEMLNHHERGRKTFGERAKHMTQRPQAAGGGRECYDIEVSANLAGSISCVVVRDKSLRPDAPQYRLRKLFIWGWSQDRDVKFDNVRYSGVGQSSSLTSRSPRSPMLDPQYLLNNP